MPQLIALIIFSLLNRQQTKSDRRYKVIKTVVYYVWRSATVVLVPVTYQSINRFKAFISRHKDQFKTGLVIVSGVLWVSQWMRERDY